MEDLNPLVNLFFYSKEHVLLDDSFDPDSILLLKQLGLNYCEGFKLSPPSFYRTCASLIDQLPQTKQSNINQYEQISFQFVGCLNALVNGNHF